MMGVNQRNSCIDSNQSIEYNTLYILYYSILVAHWGIKWLGCPCKVYLNMNKGKTVIYKFVSFWNESFKNLIKAKII